MTNTNRLASSFRDSSGYVFEENGDILRAVIFSYKQNYDYLMDSGLYDTLVSKNYLVRHQELDKQGSCDIYKIIKPAKISFISYPYEWSFSQLKDAALLTLKIHFIALKHKMTLKDASAYNVQFSDGRPIFIDTLSFEKYKEGSSWVAYRQFCQHFLAPLLLMSYKDIRLGQLLKNYIDGIPLDLANKLLPLNAKIVPSVFFNISVQADLQKKYENKNINPKNAANISSEQLILINKQLQDLISGLSFPIKSSEWGEYYTFTNYNDKAFSNKKEIVETFIDKVGPSSLWDFGANNGLFTRIASSKGVNSVAFDIDPIACEKNYLDIKKNGDKNIQPILFDLTNPSPSIGWANIERSSIAKRGNPDMIMALALIHHIAICNNVPLEKIAQYFSTLSKYLIIEFVPKEDSQVQKLLSTREDVFKEYHIDGFETNFSKYYNILDKQSIEGSSRTFYLLEKKC